MICKKCLFYSYFLTAGLDIYYTQNTVSNDEGGCLKFYMLLELIGIYPEIKKFDGKVLFGV